MIKTCFTIILLLVSLLIKAQVKNEIVLDTADTGERIKIEVEVPKKPIDPRKNDIRYLIFKSITTRAFRDSLAAIPTNEAHMFSIAVSFNSLGEVDTIYFSAKMTPRLKDLLKPGDELKSEITKRISSSKLYKNVVILFPVIFHYRDHEMIKKDILIEDLNNLWPVFSAKDKIKKLILLELYNCWIVQFY